MVQILNYIYIFNINCFECVKMISFRNGSINSPLEYRETFPGYIKL